MEAAIDPQILWCSSICCLWRFKVTGEWKLVKQVHFVLHGDWDTSWIRVWNDSRAGFKTTQLQQVEGWRLDCLCKTEIAWSGALAKRLYLFVGLALSFVAHVDGKGDHGTIKFQNTTPHVWIEGLIEHAGSRSKFRQSPGGVSFFFWIVTLSTCLNAMMLQ